MLSEKVDLHYKSSLTSVLNTPATVYQPFHVLITEKQRKMDSGWLETPSGMLIGMGGMSAAQQLRL